MLPPENAERLLHSAWEALEDHFGTGILCTTDAAGAPHARTVVLRDFSARDRRLLTYSDRRAAKVAHLRLQPATTWLFWDRGQGLQIRLTGATRLLPEEAARRIWDDLPPDRRTDYAADPAPGTPVREATDGIPDDFASNSREATDRYFANFAILQTTIEQADILRLSDDGHRRAVFNYDSTAGDWRGGWVIP